MLRSVEVDPRIAEAVDLLPLGPFRAPLEASGAYVVGGWVRELVARRDPGGDVDVAIEGDLDALLDDLDPELGIDVHERHRRFGTATVAIGGLRVDLTRTRRERYAHPGALPDVEPAPIAEDLGRRDFTVNAMAASLSEPGALLDPFGGAADLRTGFLRILHDGSFVDDPTRAIRAARYAARLGLEPEPDTLALLGATDLRTVSDDRRDAELSRLAAEDEAARGFVLLTEWGAVDLDSESLRLIAAVSAAASGPAWAGDAASRSRAILLVAQRGERAEAALRLAEAEPDRPSEAVRLAAGHQPAELLIATAAGAGWIDEYLSSWRSVGLAIDGGDLLAAGLPEGPAVGRALRGVLERKLDGGLSGGREAELQLALALARQEKEPI